MGVCEEFSVRLIADYLLDRVRSFSTRLVSKLKGFWDRVFRPLLRDLVVNLLANVIYDVLKLFITGFLLK